MGNPVDLLFRLKLLNYFIFIIKQDIHNKFAMAGQTAESNGLTFVVDTHGWPEDVII